MYKNVGEHIKKVNVKEGINEIFDFINYANKYFDERTPWILVKENKQKCNDVLFNYCNIIYNANTLLKPYLPFTCDKVDEYLKISNNNWEYRHIDKVDILNDIKPLYEKYDKKIIDEEISEL